MAATQARPLKVATFNVNGIATRLEHLLAWLKKDKPDIVCLQELKARDEQFPNAELETLGYQSLWVGQPAWNGVAVLVRDGAPHESIRTLPGDPRDEQSRYLEVAAHGLIVACLYAPNGNPRPGPKFDYKLKWLDRLIQRAGLLIETGHPVILAGDFNIIPSDQDVYKPESWKRDALFQPESQSRYRKLIEQGWMDGVLEIFGDARVYTFWDYFRRHWERDCGIRIDHLLLSPSLAPRLLDAGVDRWVRGLPKASDHAPTWVRLQPEKRKRPSKPSSAKRVRVRA